MRTAKGLSIRDLARASRVSKSTISALENDPTRIPSVRTLMRLATALNVSIDHLLTPGAAA